MNNHPDITIRADGAFIPHSGAADEFVFCQFGMIGDRDLTSADINAIRQRATDRGFIVNNQFRG